MHPFGDPRMARSTGWHPGSASPWWHRGGTGVALSWGSQQHPAAGLAPAETEKSRWRLRHLPPCLLSPIPFFSSSLQQNQPLWREALHAVGHRGCRFVPAGRSSSEMCLQVKSKTLRGALGAAPEGLFFFFLGMELMSLEAQNAKPYRMQLPADGAISSFALFYVGFPTPELHPHLVLMLPPHSSGVGNVCAFHRQCTGDLTAVGTRRTQLGFVGHIAMTCWWPLLCQHLPSGTQCPRHVPALGLHSRGVSCCWDPPCCRHTVRAEH